MHKNAWEIENIEIEIDYEAMLLQKFNIFDDSKLIQTHLFKISQTEDFINEIKNSLIFTGIMLSYLQINDIIIYLFILDDTIFIIKQINLPKFQEYFNEHKDLLIFKTAKCYDDFFKAIYSKFLNSEEKINI